MRNRIARFMAGRNGNDQLNIFLLILAVLFIVLGMIFKNSGRIVFNTLTLASIVIVYIRMLSKNLEKRRAENSRYMDIRFKVLSMFRLRREMWSQRNDYKFFHCPSCRTVLRVPRGRGKIMIVCKKCGTRFEGKS